MPRRALPFFWFLWRMEPKVSPWPGRRQDSLRLGDGEQVGYGARAFFSQVDGKVVHVEPDMGRHYLVVHFLGVASDELSRIFRVVHGMEDTA